MCCMEARSVTVPWSLLKILALGACWYSVYRVCPALASTLP
jgi:hypothetical protein